MRLASFASLALAVSVASSASAAHRCGTHALRELMPALRADSRTRAAGPRAPVASPAVHEPGDVREFWAWDLGVMPPGFRKVTAVCKVATDSSYLFVEQDLIDRGKVTESDVRKLDTAMHRRTPAYSVAPREGILDIEFSRLGPPPDTLDGDPRVFFLVLRMDEFNGMGFDGYFNAFDQLTEEEAWEQYEQHSNEMEILYLNGERGNISSNYMRGVLAHELSHLIEFGFDPQEFNWLGETLAEGAMQLTGYFTDNAHVRRFAAHPESPLVRDQYANYGAGFLFSAWLQGRFGHEILGSILRDAGHGTASVEGLMAAAGHPQAFEDAHAEWARDNLWAGLGRRVKAYRHEGLIVPRFAEKASLGAEGGTVVGQLKTWGFQYLRLAPGGYTVTRQGDARLHELLPGRAPRALLVEEEESLLERLDEPRWLLVTGGQAPDWAVTVAPLDPVQ